MFTLLQADNADDLWLKSAHCFCPGAIAVAQASRGGATREVMHAALTLRDPRQRWIASREPAMNPAFALAEVTWIIAGRNDSAFLNYFNPRLPKFAGDGPVYHGAYGYRLRRAFAIDQLKRAAAALRGNSNSRQVVLQIWDSERDFPNVDGQPVSPDIPCNIVSMLKVRDRKLEWTQVMRSNDLFLGLPHNLIQFTSLQEIIAGWIGVGLGSYNHLSDSLHLYEHDEYVLCATEKQSCPPNTDDLARPEKDAEMAWGLLAAQVDKIIDASTKVTELMEALEGSTISASFQNILAVLIAEGCRRRRDMDAAAAAIGICKNPCFVFLWNRWLQRNKETGPPPASSRKD